MQEIDIFQNNIPLSDIIKKIKMGEQLCFTESGIQVAFVIPAKNYINKTNPFQKLYELKKRAPIGTVEEIIQMRDLGRK